ncbi:HAD family hydrolase [Virgibacillus soli]|uniref:HAD family phosphatase n=2 Tax=Paracerasibacillus soli TaxID=480284 RepID=A0ABU5CS16_9BACI|nr:HAD family phosphatase [Virgibacillus soli]MDY0409126.1 HAD family phosphatase [Virgibacillus soli]
MDQIKFVIFDMDGLLFDTETVAYRAMKKVMDKAGFPFTMDIYRKIIGAGSDEDERILQSVYGDTFTITSIQAPLSKEFDDIIKAEGIRVMPGVHELLDILDQKQIKKCIASSSPLSTIQSYLQMTHLSDRFDFYMSGEEVERGKPNPDIFIEACRRAREEAETSLVLEDSLNGLRAAHGADIACILVPDLIEPNEEMKAKAYKVVPSLRDVVEMLK